MARPGSDPGSRPDTCRPRMNPRHVKRTVVTTAGPRSSRRGRRGAPWSGSAWSASPPTWSTRAPARSPARTSPRSAPRALVVGVVTGAGEAAALVLRLVSGPLADRSGRYWALTIVGYAMTAGLRAADGRGPVPRRRRAGLRRHDGAARAHRQGDPQPLEVGAARARRPARWAAAAGFAVHKALDQVGAFAGPAAGGRGDRADRAHLGRAGVLAVPAWSRWCCCWCPGAGARHDACTTARAPRPGAEQAAARRRRRPVGCRAASTLFALSCAAEHPGPDDVRRHLLPPVSDADLVRAALVPVVYAVAMAVEAVSALATGFAYDRVGRAGAAGAAGHGGAGAAARPRRPAGRGARRRRWSGVPPSASRTRRSRRWWPTWCPSARLATAYGVFAAFQGGAALAGGALAGWLYSGGDGCDLVVVLGACQVVSLVLLVRGAQAATG